MDTLNRLQAVMRQVFFDDTLQVSARTTALDVAGWDSLSHSMLLLEVEQAFGIEIDVDAATRCADVGELVTYLGACRADSAAVAAMPATPRAVLQAQPETTP